MFETEWKAVTDPRTGRTYYYDPVSLETRWEKPLDREELQKQTAFFSEMEANIRSKLRRTGGLSCDIEDGAAASSSAKSSREIDIQAAATFPSVPPAQSLKESGSVFQFGRVRTLSSVDDSVMRPADQTYYDYGASGRIHGTSADDSMVGGAAVAPPGPMPDALPVKQLSVSSPVHASASASAMAPRPPALASSQSTQSASSDGDPGASQPTRPTRRSSASDAVDDAAGRPRCNTTSTIQVDNTMSAPDRDASIQWCVNSGTPRAYVCYIL
eukprot:g5457.t1